MEIHRIPASAPGTPDKYSSNINIFERLKLNSEGYAEDYVASNSRVAELFHFGLSW